MVCKLLVKPEDSAAEERLFFAAQRWKTWLRSTKKGERFSNLTILNTHKQRTDTLAYEFIACSDHRKKKFRLNHDLIESYMS